MDTGMSDTNIDNVCNGRKSSDSPIRGIDSNELYDSAFGCLSQMFQNSLSIGDTNSRSESFSGTKDNPLSDGINSNANFNLSHRWFAANGYIQRNGLDVSPPKQRTRPPMRAIRKNSDSQVVYTTPPIDCLSGSEAPPRDWYNTFVEQTQRFAEMNGKCDKQSNQKHVHFKDQYEDPFEDKFKDEFNGIASGGEDSDHNCLLESNNSLGNGFGPQIDSSDSGIEGIDGNHGRNWRSGFGSTSTPFRSYPRTDSWHNDFVPRVANNCLKESIYFGHQLSRNMSHISSQKSSLSTSPVPTPLPATEFFGNSIWTNPTNPSNSIYRILSDVSDSGKSTLEKLLNSGRKTVPKTGIPNYTWSGQLPRRVRTKTPVYSCKVFLGGIPYDLTDSDLHCTFAQFGHIQIQWPGKEIRSAIDGAAANKAGYVYIIFETYDNVAALLAACTLSYRDMDSGCRWYYSISSRRQKSKEVQVIPFDIGDRFFMKSSFSGQMEHSRTVFVGALHGMLAADGLAKVMDDLFGGVIFAGLDTDKHKYPLGSGRVTFDSAESYQKAVSAAFVEIKSSRFKKKIQIDPYIESESICVICRAQTQNPIYCREEGLYFCPDCWSGQHSDPESLKHRPIVKNKSSKA